MRPERILSLSLSLSLSSPDFGPWARGLKCATTKLPPRREGAPRSPRVSPCRARMLSRGAEERCSTIVQVHFGTRELAGMQARSERMRAVKRFAEERIFILRVHDHRTLVMRGGEGLLRYTRRGSARSSSPTRNRLRRATKQVRSDAARASLLIIISEILRDDK